MNTSEDSAQHYHRAVAATKQGDIDIAIAELDLCLCSNPPITSSMIAWFDLNTVIVRKFDFPHREGSTISDEEFMWQHRAEKCLKNVISIYEDTISHTAKAAAYRNLYERAKDRLARTSGFGEIMLDAGGTLSLRSTEVFFRVTLPPLKCLAEQERKRRKEERLVYERTAPLRGGYRMQDVVRYLVRGLEFASENQKVPATEFLTKVVENLDESDPEHRKLLETAHFRLAALHSDLDNSEEAVKHAEWVLRNAPPANEALRMMLETILKMYGRNIHVAWKRPNIAPRNDPASTSGSMS
ncbi:MAG: hypothetical protein ACREEM_49450, partial [Blastocatellia bacterium]